MVLPVVRFLVKLHPLPVQLTHTKDPLVLRQVVLPLQLCFPVAHSSISAKGSSTKSLKNILSLVTPPKKSFACRFTLAITSQLQK